jgi:hypothetical protein
VGYVSSSNSTFDLFFSLSICGASAVTAGDVRVFGKLYIQYNRLIYMSEYIWYDRYYVLYVEYHIYLEVSYNSSLILYIYNAI